MEPLRDLHLYLWPKCLWKIYERTGLVEFIPGLISLGFIRIHPESTLRILREEIDSQMGDDFPQNYHFLKQVGRKMAIIKQRQEDRLFASDFLPPVTSSPDLFVIENETIEINYLYSNAASINDVNNEKISSMTGHSSTKKYLKSPQIVNKKIKSGDIREFEDHKKHENQNFQEEFPQIKEELTSENENFNFEIFKSDEEKKEEILERNYSDSSSAKKKLKNKRKKQSSHFKVRENERKSKKMKKIEAVAVDELSSNEDINELNDFDDYSDIKINKRSSGKNDKFKEESTKLTFPHINDEFLGKDKSKKIKPSKRKEVDKFKEESTKLTIPHIKDEFLGKYKSKKIKPSKRKELDLPVIVDSKFDTMNELYDSSEFFEKNVSKREESENQSDSVETRDSLENEKIKKHESISKRNIKFPSIKNDQRSKKSHKNRTLKRSRHSIKNNRSTSDVEEIPQIRKKLSKEEQMEIHHQLEQIKELEMEMDKAQLDLLNPSEAMNSEDSNPENSQTSEEKEENLRSEREINIELKSIQNEVQKSDNERNYLIRQLENLENNKKSRKNDWKFKYMAEKKLTGELELEVTKNESILNNIHQNKLRYNPHTQPVVQKNISMKPGRTANLIIVKTQLDLEIDKLKREEELLKTRLFIEMKIKNEEKERADKNKNILRQYRYETNDHRHRYAKILANCTNYQNQSDFSLPKLG